MTKKTGSPLDTSLATDASAASREVARRSQKADIVPRKEQRTLAIDRLKEIESELLETSKEIVTDAMAWHTLAPDAKGPPEQWIDLWGDDEAWSKFRRVMAGHMPSGEAPIGLKVATNIASSILKKTRDEDRSPVLNIKVAEMTISPTYQTIKVEK